jgi:hypothetical protein
VLTILAERLVAGHYDWYFVGLVFHLEEQLQTRSVCGARQAQLLASFPKRSVFPQ